MQKVKYSNLNIYKTKYELTCKYGDVAEMISTPHQLSNIDTNNYP